MGKLDFIKPCEFYYHLLIKYSAKQLWKHLSKQGYGSRRNLYGEMLLPHKKQRGLILCLGVCEVEPLFPAMAPFEDGSGECSMSLKLQLAARPQSLNDCSKDIKMGGCLLLPQ